MGTCDLLLGKNPVMDDMQARSGEGSTPLMWAIGLSAPSILPSLNFNDRKSGIKFSQGFLFGGGGERGGEGIIAHFNLSKIIRIKGKPHLALTIFTYLMSLSKFLYQVLAFSYWKSSPVVIKILLVL